MIRNATEVDGPRIRELTARAGVFRQDEVECLGALWDEYLVTGPRASGYNFLVACDGDQVVGYACYGPRDLTSGVYDLYWIAVDPERRGGGVGSGLLAASEAGAREAGGRLMIAETSGTPLYEATRAFYASRGYQAEATIRDFYVEGDDLVIYVKRFSTSDEAPETPGRPPPWA